MDLILFRSKDDEELYNYIEDLWEPFLEWINLEFNCRLIVNYELFQSNKIKMKFQNAFLWLKILITLSFRVFHILLI